MSDLKNRLIEAKGSEPLGVLLRSLIDDVCKKHRIPKEYLIKEIATETGLQKGSVLRILKGKVKAPPIKRLEGFSRILENYLK